MTADSLGTRPLFYCAHEMTMYASFAHAPSEIPVAAEIAERGTSLPGFPVLSPSQMEHAVRSPRHALTVQSAFFLTLANC